MNNDNFTMELVCCESTILNEIKHKECKRNDIALTYYFCMVSLEDIDWGKVNRAIVERWSRSGLEYIKKEAYKWHKKKIRQRELEALINNCTDDDEKILLKRELGGIEEVNNCLYCGVKLDFIPTKDGGFCSIECEDSYFETGGIN